MLAKKTSKNQITLPRAIVRQIPATDYFDVSLHEGAVLLKPVVVSVPGEQLDVVRKKVRALGVTENDVKRDAVGQGAGTLMRVVLDPNTLVSALLFGGPASRLVAWWQSERITLLVSGKLGGPPALPGVG